jgi:hypothetical protein
MIRIGEQYIVKLADLDLANPIECDVRDFLKRKPDRYLYKADLERDKKAYKEALQKEPLTRKPGHTYVPRSFKKPGWTTWVRRSADNWDPERDAMSWIVGTYTTTVHSIEEVEALYRDWIDKNRQKKGTPNNFIARIVSRGKCPHGIAHCTYCAGCEKCYMDVLDYLAHLRVRVLEYEAKSQDDKRKTEEKPERERAGREGQQRQRENSNTAMYGKMNATYALEILGLKAGAKEQEIQTAYRRLIKRLHPDVGGSDAFAKQLNAARDVLLG